MNFGNKLIKDLTDDELWVAIYTVGGIANFRFDKLKDPRINKSKHRLNKIFISKPPVENETFINLAIALNKEYQNRNKPNVEN